MTQPIVRSDAPTSAAGRPDFSPNHDSGWRTRVVRITLAYLVFRGLVGLVQLPPSTPAWLILVAFALVAAGSIGLPIAGLAVWAKSRPATKHALAVGVGGLLLWGCLAVTLRYFPDVLRPLAFGLLDLGKIAAAGGFGLALGSVIREPNILAPAGIFAAFADFVVVNFGTVHHALQSEQGAKVIEAVSAQVPAVHPRLQALTIGPADFLFLGFFLACAARFRLGVRRNAIILTAVLTLSLILVPIIGAIPALAPMSVAFLVTNWRRFRLTRQEVISTFVVLGVAGALFLAYFLFLFPALVPPPTTPPSPGR